MLHWRLTPGLYEEEFEGKHDSVDDALEGCIMMVCDGLSRISSWPFKKMDVWYSAPCVEVYDITKLPVFGFQTEVALIGSKPVDVINSLK